METTIANSTDTEISKIQMIFDLQQKNQFKIAKSQASERIAKLSKLHKAILNNRTQIKEALFKDFKKHPSEVDLVEIYPVTSGIKHAKSNLRKWMKRKKVATPPAFLGSSSFIKYEPKGVVLIISPWNFPINLTFGPLISAIAAGNTVILKPSEHTPHASAVMKEIIDELFDESEIALVEGGVETSKALLELPFNHIFFTGAPSIGKIVMKAAANHLASVTLELGGKSPVIVDESAKIETAAKRIAWGKYLNNGQVCLAPDHIYVHNSHQAEFLELIKKYTIAYYTEDASKESSYSRIVNNNHYQRIKSYIDDAVDSGAKFELGGVCDGEQDYISPTIMTGVKNNSKLMTEEIFGPVLPIQGFTSLKDVIEDINSREKPLALYIYSQNKENINSILDNTRAGGSCINHNGVHFYNHNLPFGGANNSGIGKCHGVYGFESFSNARGVLTQHIPNALERLLPPYNKAKQKIIDMTIKYF